MPSEIPDDVKKNVRAVLLSNDKGVVVSQFCRDYTKLLQKKLNWRNLGFSSLEDFIMAMPDVVRLEYCSSSMAYKMYGICDPNSYVGLAAKKASGMGAGKGRGKWQTNKKDVGRPRYPGHTETVSVCFPNCDLEDIEIQEKFSAAGFVTDVHQTTTRTFVRYGSREEAEAAVTLFRDELDVSIALSKDKSKENTNPSHPRNGTPDHRPRQWGQEGGHEMWNGGNKTGGNPVELYISGLDLSATEDDVCQEILAGVPFLSHRFRVGNTCNMMFVDVPSMDEAQFLIDKWNSNEWRGSHLKVSIARSKNRNQEPRGRGGFSQPQSQQSYGFQRAVEREAEAPETSPETWDLDEPDSKSGNWSESGSNEGSFRRVGNGKSFISPGKARHSSDSDSSSASRPRATNKWQQNQTSRSPEAAGLPKGGFGSQPLQQGRASSGPQRERFPSGRSDVSQPGRPPRPAESQDVRCSGTLGERNGPKPKGQKPGKAVVNAGGFQRTPGQYNGQSDTLVRENGVQGASPRKPVWSPSPPRPQQNKERGRNGAPSALPDSAGDMEMPPLEEAPVPAASRTSGSSVLSKSPQNPPSVPLGQKHQWQEGERKGRHGNSAENDMPPLEAVGEPARTALLKQPLLPQPQPKPQPELQPPLPPLEPAMPKQNSSSGECLGAIVSNFPTGTTERELHGLLFQYNVQKISMINNDLEERRTIAFAMFNHEADAEQAVASLNNKDYFGCSLKLKLYREHDDFSSAEAPIAASSSSVGSSPHKPLSSAAGDGPVNYEKPESLLMSYMHILKKLHAYESYNIKEGTRAKVLLTHVCNDAIFWAQDLSEAGYEKIRTLAALSSLMQNPSTATTTPKFPQHGGRCTAKYQGENYRAWALRDNKEGGDVPVFFLDYGNVSLVPKEDVQMLPSVFWSFPPLALPFQLQGATTEKLKGLELSTISVDIIKVDRNRTLLASCRLVDQQ